MVLLKGLTRAPYFDKDNGQNAGAFVVSAVEIGNGPAYGSREKHEVVNLSARISADPALKPQRNACIKGLANVAD